MRGRNAHHHDASEPAFDRPRGLDDLERAPSGALLLESAWEVCNQLGGIYQVIRSKSPTMVRRWRNRYILIGPYVPAKAALEFEERRPVGWLARAIDNLAAQGLTVRHGRWLIPTRPKVLLVESDAIGLDELNAAKYDLWDRWGVDTASADGLIDGVIRFSQAVRRVMHEVSRQWTGVLAGEAGAGRRADRRLILHGHEWMGGAAIPLLRADAAAHDSPARRVATVFTTHATQLGRTIAWNDEWFYDHLPFLDHAHEAARFNVRAQHGIERACAHASHVFTTVSQITGEECSHLLGRSPDMILPNGLNIENYNVGHEFQTLHAQFKDQINKFAMGHFFPSYGFDLDKTLYFFTSGRCEPRNKGFDLCIEAMARLNAELKSARIDKTVVFFIVTQRPVRSLHPDVLHMRGVLNELETVCRRITDEVGAGLFRRAAAGHKVVLDDLVREYWTLRFRRTQQAFKTDRLPLVVTHLLEDDATDEVLGHIRRVWLFNKPDDPVKIVYHPQFISPVNPLWGMDYDQFVRGCHMGIFPSAYEPWGYTPLEAMALGVPSITSDLAGFGRYVDDTLPALEGCGLTVLRRRGRTFNEAAADLARCLLDFCRLDRRGRIDLRNQIERHSWEFDWAKLARAYDWAHDLAMARAGISS